MSIIWQSERENYQIRIVTTTAFHISINDGEFKKSLSYMEGYYQNYNKGNQLKKFAIFLIKQEINMVKK